VLSLLASDLTGIATEAGKIPASPIHRRTKILDVVLAYHHAPGGPTNDPDERMVFAEAKTI
jgi:hypothetical protein